MKFKLKKLSFILYGLFISCNSQASIVFDKTVFEYDDAVTPSGNVDWVDGTEANNNLQYAYTFEPGDQYSYLFNMGGHLNNLDITGSYLETVLNFQTATNSSLMVGNLYGTSIRLKVGAKAHFEGGNISFGNENTGSITAIVKGGSELTVNAQNLTFTDGSNPLFVHWDSDLPWYIFQNQTSTFRAHTDNDFIIQDFGTYGIYSLSGQYGSSNVEVVSENDIRIQGGNEEHDAAGIWTMSSTNILDPDFPYHTGTSVVKLKASNEIDIIVAGKGIQTYGGSTVELRAKAINIQTEDDGIYRLAVRDMVRDGIVSLDAEQIKIDSKERAVFTDTYGKTELNASKSISLNENGNPNKISLEARNPQTVLLINKDKTQVGKLVLTGGVSAYNEATIDISGGEDSVFTGWTQESEPAINNQLISSYDNNPDAPGTINLKLGNNSKWVITANSDLTNLAINNSLLDFSSFQQPQQTAEGGG